MLVVSDSYFMGGDTKLVSSYKKRKYRGREFSMYTLFEVEE